MAPHPLLSLWFVARAGRFRLRQPRPHDSATLQVPGADPIRVLVTGAGLATGYGVETHDEALAGPLARRLAERTGRGVTVQVRSAPLLPARAAVDHIGVEGARGYDVAVYAPCYLEASFAPDAGLGRYGAAIQQHLLDTGGDALRLVMLAIPRPSRFSRLDLAAAQAADAANRVLRSTAASSGQVQVVEAPPFSTVRTDRPFDGDYYARLGSAVADELVPALTARGRGGEGDRRETA